MSQHGMFHFYWIKDLKPKSCFFHPLSNDTSISLNARYLEKFLKSSGRDPSYVDLEANPPVGKDQPPDLASLVPSGSVVLSDPPEKNFLCKVLKKTLFLQRRSPQVLQ